MSNEISNSELKLVKKSDLIIAMGVDNRYYDHGDNNRTLSEDELNAVIEN